jgi:hypothetical protein
MKMLKFALITIVVLIITSIVAFYVNYYHYSWTSFINPFGCSCKKVSVKFAGVDKRNEILTQQYDLQKIYQGTKSNDKYKSVFFNGHSLGIERKFNDVVYKIHFSSTISSSGTIYSIYFSNGSPYEPKTTPNAYIKNNIEQMIDEMPLTNEQKTELKNKVSVWCQQTVSLSW